MNRSKGFSKMLMMLFAALSSFVSYSQTIPYSRDYAFTEGAFLSIEHFKNNDPIAKEAIVSSYPKGQVDFMTTVMEAKYLIYKDKEGVEQKIETLNLWGYCQNRSVFLNYNKEFCKLNVIGTLCHFIGKKYTPVGYTDPMNYNYGINTSEDQHQFVLDTQSDKVLDFNVSNMETILQADPELHAEFMLIKRRKKQDSIFIYLRKYNEKHPLYLSAK